ncbi:MAG TPA: hypothetical protein VFA74_14975 [Terriglobales bacterium]|nr:hypothetical protein [Terriglobales bacterium]
MPKLRRDTTFLPPDDVTLSAIKKRKVPPHAFVIDAIAALQPETRSMFGCLAVYVEDKIVLALRDKSDKTEDNGVWLATSKEHHDSLRREFPNMRSIQIFEKEITSWQVLPASAPDFEESALRACELITAHDPRIGKVPERRRTSASRTGKPSKPKTRTRTQKH